jgi:hypothetical protein
MFVKGLNLSLAKLSIAHIASNLAPILAVPHRSNPHFQSFRLHGSHFHHLLSPLLLLSSLRASVTASSIQNVQTDRLIEASSITSPLAFTFSHCPVVICRSCVFKMVNVARLITIGSTADDCGYLKFVGCAISDSSVSDTVTHAHELVMERSAVERVSGMFADSKLIPECDAKFNDTVFGSDGIFLKTWLYAFAQIFQSVNVTKGAFDRSPFMLAAAPAGNLWWSCCNFDNISIIHDNQQQRNFVWASFGDATQFRVERCTFSDIQERFLFFADVPFGSPMQQMVFEAICVCRSGNRFATTTESLALVLTNCVFDVVPELNWDPNAVSQTLCIYNAMGCTSTEASNGMSTRAIDGFDYNIIAEEVQKFKSRE